jgi:murein L,D-transpeptidase YafK
MGLKYIFILIISLSLFPLATYAKTLSEVIQRIEPQINDNNLELYKKLQQPELALTILVFKKEMSVELWSHHPHKEKLATYSMTGFSGLLGPKNKQGDKQIPEGVYQATVLNPQSRFHLSVGINYPNKNDLQRAKASGINQPGNHIYIHGNRYTIGCVPVGDSNIEEIFYATYKAGVQRTQVVIAPHRPPIPDLSTMGLDPKDALLAQKYDELREKLNLFYQAPK